MVLSSQIIVTSSQNNVQKYCTKEHEQVSCCHAVNLWRRVRKLRDQKIRRASNFPLHNFSSSCINPGTFRLHLYFFRLWVTVQQIILLPSVWNFNSHLERKFIWILKLSRWMAIIFRYTSLTNLFYLVIISHNIPFWHNISKD